MTEDRTESECEVVASVDGEGNAREFVVADLSTDRAWLSMDAGDAPVLSAWR